MNRCCISCQKIKCQDFLLEHEIQKPKHIVKWAGRGPRGNKPFLNNNINLLKSNIMGFTFTKICYQHTHHMLIVIFHPHCKFVEGFLIFFTSGKEIKNSLKRGDRVSEVLSYKNQHKRRGSTLITNDTLDPKLTL